MPDVALIRKTTSQTPGKRGSRLFAQQEYGQEKCPMTNMGFIVLREFLKSQCFLLAWPVFVPRR